MQSLILAWKEKVEIIVVTYRGQLFSTMRTTGALYRVKTPDFDWG